MLSICLFWQTLVYVLWHYTIDNALTLGLPAKVILKDERTKKSDGKAGSGMSSRPYRMCDVVQKTYSRVPCVPVALLPA